MALRLLIFRHAKSGWDAPSDHERTLTELGVQQAKFMGEQLKEREVQPDLVICSSADRARTTMNLAMSAGEWECDSTTTDLLYNTTSEVMLGLISQFSDHDATVMIVGHEPTWSELAKLLTGEEVNFNTAGMCSVYFDAVHWHDVEPGSGKLEWYESP